jgi:hypothetical protein
MLLLKLELTKKQIMRHIIEVDNPNQFNPEQVGAALEGAEDRGVLLSDLFAEGSTWTRLDINTGAGVISLEPLNFKEGKAPQVKVVESQDPSMEPGDVILLEGASMNGGSMKPNVLSPQTRLAFTKPRVKHYEVGDIDGGSTYTQETIDKYSSDHPYTFRKVEGGMDVVFPGSPNATDFVADAQVIEEIDGQETSRTLF